MPLKDFKLPSGSWEEDVEAIDVSEGTDGKAQAHLTWIHGLETQHPLDTVYKHCPQKVSSYFEWELFRMKC